MFELLNCGRQCLSAHLLRRHILFRLFLHHLGHGHFKIFLGDVDTTLAQGVHARLGTHTLVMNSNINVSVKEVNIIPLIRRQTRLSSSRLPCAGWCHESSSSCASESSKCRHGPTESELDEPAQKTQYSRLRWGQETRFYDQCDRGATGPSRGCQYDWWPWWLNGVVFIFS